MSVKLIIRAYLHYILRSERLKLSKTKIGEEKILHAPVCRFCVCKTSAAVSDYAYDDSIRKVSFYFASTCGIHILI